MKKVVFRMLVSCLVVALVMVSMASSQVQSQEKPMEFVLVYHSTAIAFVAPIIKGMNEAAKQLGVKASFIGPPDYDIAKEVAALESAIVKGVDGIATTIPDEEAFDGAIQRAIDKGIPVIAYNVDDADTPNARMAMIVQDNLKAGREVGEKIVELVGDGAKVLLTTEVPGHVAVEARLKGIREILDKHNISSETIDTTTDLSKATSIVMTYYRGHPDVDGWFGASATATAGGCKALEKLGLKGKIYVGGWDLTPTTLQAIKEGYCLFTVDQFPYIQGYYSVVQLYLYKKYGIYPQDIPIGAGFVTPENVEQVMDLAEQHYR
jgi:simple sugar transport system substrate-binding protein